MESSSNMQQAKRRLTNEDTQKYEPLVEKFIRDSVVKNWSDAKVNGPNAFLGNSGYSLEDIRQHLRTELCIALQNYNPSYRTKEGKSVKESTFVYQHLSFRVGQMMKRLTKRRTGYGIHHNSLDKLIEDNTDEYSVLDLDLVTAIDKKRELKAKNKSQVEQWLDKKRRQ